MTPSISFSIRDEATPAIAAKAAKCDLLRLAMLLRDPLRAFWRDHLKGLPSNKKGWPSTGFWEEAADSVDATASEEGVSLQGHKIGLRQRYYGGTIAPVNADALTIPISPISYGHTASEFPGLFLLRTKKGAYLVQSGVEIDAKTGRVNGIGRKGRGNAGQRRVAALNFLFKLVASVTQAPNPDVVPRREEFLEVGMAVIERGVA